MLNKKHKIILALLIYVAGLIIVLHFTSPKPIVTDQQLSAYVAEMIPQVEKIVGRKFQANPKYKLITKSDLTPILIDSWSAVGRMRYPGIDTNQIRKKVKYDVRGFTESCSGVYVDTTKTIYILPENIRKEAANEAKIKPQQMSSHIKLIIAHELTHAMQDQELKMNEAYGRARSDEQHDAFWAVTEGQAIFVTRRLETSLGAQGIEDAIYNALYSSRLKDMDVATKINYERRNHYIRYLYDYGCRFIAWHYEHGGNDRVWQILANPPKDVNKVIHPERYGQKRVQSIDYAAMLDGLDKRLGSQNWPVQNRERSEMEMRSAFAGIDPSLLDKILDGMEHAQLLSADNDKVSVDIRLYVLKNPALARMFLIQLEKSFDDRFQSLRNSKELKVIDVTSTDFKGINSDLARKSTVVYVANGMDTTVWVVRNKILVHVILCGVKASDKHIAKVTEEVFRRLDAVKAN